MSDQVENFVFTYFLPALAGILILVVIGMIGYVIYWLLDTVGVSIQKAQGYIEDVSFTAQHPELQYNVALKMSMPVTVPDRWYLSVTFPDGSDVMSIDHAPFDWQKKGSAVLVNYKMGRFSKKPSVESISQLSEWVGK